MQCPACQLPLPPAATCPLCWEDRPTHHALAPVLGEESGLAPTLAPRTAELTPSAGWRESLEGLAAGSRLLLAPGTYRFDGALRLPAGLTLEGAGHERTILEGRGAEGDWSLLLYRGPGCLTMSGLTVRPQRLWWERLAAPGAHPCVLAVLGGAFLLADCAFPPLRDALPAGTGVVALDNVPGTVLRCHFVGRQRGGSVGITAGGPLWLEQSNFLRLGTGVSVQSGRLVVSQSTFAENGIGVAFRMADDALDHQLAGCVLRSCYFRDHDHAWQIEPPWRARWYDNRYEGRR